jgi:hypothetical protein
LVVCNYPQDEWQEHKQNFQEYSKLIGLQDLTEFYLIGCRVVHHYLLICDDTAILDSYIGL